MITQNKRIKAIHGYGYKFMGQKYNTVGAIWYHKPSNKLTPMAIIEADSDQEIIDHVVEDFYSKVDGSMPTRHERWIILQTLKSLNIIQGDVL